MVSACLTCILLTYAHKSCDGLQDDFDLAIGLTQAAPERTDGEPQPARQHQLKNGKNRQTTASSKSRPALRRSKPQQAGKRLSGGMLAKQG